MSEKDIERRLIAKLRSESLDQINVLDSTSTDIKTLRDLVRDQSFEVIHDNSRWNQYPNLGADVVGGMTPDIVLRSRKSEENRIIIEVKDVDPLRYGLEDSQLVRYFLHLLFTTRKASGTDIVRAVLLAAPPSWFSKQDNAAQWAYFLNTYADLASSFETTLGRINLETA